MNESKIAIKWKKMLFKLNEAKKIVKFEIFWKKRHDKWNVVAICHRRAYNYEKH